MYTMINGIATICGKTVPFSFDSEKEFLTLYTSTMPVEIPDGLDTFVGQILGTTGKSCFFKLSTPFSNDCIVCGNGEIKSVSNIDQIRAVEYLLEGYTTGSKYSEMKLSFPELNYFLPSVENAKLVDTDFVFSRLKRTAYSFSINYRGTVLSVSFDTGVNVHTCTNATAETVSQVTLKFPETEDLEYIYDLFLRVRGFFAFICNRQNIGLRNAVLIGFYQTKSLKDKKIVDVLEKTTQTFYPNQKYLEPLEEQSMLKKVPNSLLFASNLKELLQLFFEERAGDDAIVGTNSIHPSFKYRNLIDLKQSLHITAAFEYYVRSLMPEISSQATIDFIKDLESLLDDYIESATGKKKKKAKDFKKSLKPQISLEEKALKSFNGYDTWQPLAPILSEWFGDNISTLACVVNLWRNELAHEKREYEPNADVVTAIRLVEHLNYCIILRHAGYNDDEIKAILSEVLTR